MSNAATIEKRKQVMEATLSKIVGSNVELTIRGSNKITISTEEINKNLGSAISNLFGSRVIESVCHDEEVGSFVYVDLHA